MNRRLFISYIFDSFSLAYLLFVVALTILLPIDNELLQLLRNLKYFLGSFVIGALVSFLLIALKIQTLGLIIFSHDLLCKRFLNFWKYQALSLFLVTLSLSYFATKMSWTQILEKDSFEHAMNLFSQMARPDWQILPQAILKLVETIFIAFMATTLAFPFAFVLSFFSAKNLMSENALSKLIYFLLQLLFVYQKNLCKKHFLL